MADPITESAFIRAARTLGVSDLWLKLYLVDVEGDELSLTQWSHWKHSRRDLDADRLLDFIRWWQTERRRIRAELDKDVERDLLIVAAGESKKKARTSGKRGARS